MLASAGSCLIAGAADTDQGGANIPGSTAIFLFHPSHFARVNYDSILTCCIKQQHAHFLFNFYFISLL